MKKGKVPCPGIDTDARWRYSHTKKGWIFGYNLYITSTTGDLIVLLRAVDVTTANVQDNQMYVILTTTLSVFSIPLTCHMVADPGYNDKELYEYSKKVSRIDLICPV